MSHAHKSIRECVRATYRARINRGFADRAELEKYIKSISESPCISAREYETEGTIMKRITTLALIILLGIVSCSPIKQERYQSGTYTAVNSGYGYIITADGNVWGFYDRSIPSGSSVLVAISDEGTEKVEDDVITNVVEK